MNYKAKNGADIIDQVFLYQRTDNKIHCIAVIINKRFIKEDSRIKPEESKGFKHVRVMIRCEAAKIGVKAYYTSSIYQKKDDCDSEMIVSKEYEKPALSNNENKIGGWLFETGKLFHKERVLQAVDLFRELLSKGLSDGSIILERQRISKISKHKPKSMKLEDEIDQLKALLALKMN